MKDSRTFELARTGGVLLAMTLAYLFFVHRPGVNELRRIEQRIASANQELNQLPVRLAEVEHLRERIDTLRREATIHPAAPLMTSRLLKTVAQVAKTHQLAVDRLEPLEPLDLATHQVASVRAQLSGTFFQWSQLLAQLDDLPEELEILECRLTIDDSRASTRTRSAIRPGGRADAIRRIKHDAWPEQKSSSVEDEIPVRYARPVLVAAVAAMADVEKTRANPPATSQQTISGELHIARRLLPPVGDGIPTR